MSSLERNKSPSGVLCFLKESHKNRRLFQHEGHKGKGKTREGKTRIESGSLGGKGSVIAVPSFPFALFDSIFHRDPCLSFLRAHRVKCVLDWFSDEIRRRSHH